MVLGLKELKKARLYLEERDTLGLQSWLSQPYDATISSQQSLRAFLQVESNSCKGTLTTISGIIKQNMMVRLQPSGQENQIISFEEDKSSLHSSVYSVTFAKPLPQDQEQVVSATDSPAQTANQFEVTLISATSSSLFPGRKYQVVMNGQKAEATITDIKYIRDHNDIRTPAKKLTHSDIAVCNISINHALVFDPYHEQAQLGCFQLFKTGDSSPIALGLIHFALRRSQNIHMQHVEINKSERAILKGQKPCVLWFTGLSGAGKSTIANLVEKKLHSIGHHTYLLDGDNVRHGLNKDLGFTVEDRVENIRRIAEVAHLMVDAGLIVLTAFISPFHSERELARGLVQAGEFFEIFVDIPLSLAEERDPKGLYRKARSGELKNFTGIDSIYEAPVRPEIHLNSAELTPEQAADKVIEALQQKGIIQSPNLLSK